MKTIRATFALFLLLAAPISRAAIPADPTSTTPAAPSAPSTKFTEITDQLQKLFGEQQNYTPHVSNLTRDQLIAEMAKPGYKRERALTDIQDDIKNQISLLVGEDPKAAVSWVQNSGNVPYNTLVLVFHAWAEMDPKSAAAYAEQQSSGTDTTRAIMEVAEAWTQTDRTSALAWAESLSGQSRENAITASLRVMAETDGPTAWNYAVNHLNKDGYVSSFPSVVNAWSKTDPAAAAAALAALPENPLLTNRYDNIVMCLINNWIDKDPPAVSQWAAGLPEGALRTAVNARLNLWDSAHAALDKAGGGSFAMTSNSIIVFPRSGSGTVFNLHSPPTAVQPSYPTSPSASSKQ